MKTLSEQEPEQQLEQRSSKASQTNTVHILKPNMGMHERMQHIGREFVDICHYIILFLISVVVVWTAGKEFFVIFQKGSADLKDILSSSAVKPRHF
ncbi:hypothetical protein [Psychrobacter faecalis]